MLSVGALLVFIASCEKTSLTDRPEVPSSQEDENEDDEESRLKLHPVLVSVKSLGKFLNAHIISTTTMACE
jgi:hypothetical protein